MLAPVLPYALRGVLWYQGESNSFGFSKYPDQLLALMDSWRGLFQIPAMPFLITELAPWGEPEAVPEDQRRPRFSEALSKVSKADANAFVITIADAGDTRGFHSHYKDIVADRFAAMALAKVYGREGVAHGPTFASWHVEGTKAVLKFHSVGAGLVAKAVNLDGHKLGAHKLQGFDIADSERRFYRGDAVITAPDTITVSAPEITTAPAAVRFGWAQFPLVNLYNKEGFAAYPFRTDDWPWLTPKPLIRNANLPGSRPSMLKSEFIYDTGPFPQIHATTIVETPTGLVASWFGGTGEGHKDVCIWISRQLPDGTWSACVEAAHGVQPDGTRHPTWNPILFQPRQGPLMLFYKVGPSPSKWWGELKTSHDGGQSWSDARKLPDGIYGPIKNKPIQLANGDILCPTSVETEAEVEVVQNKRVEKNPSRWSIYFERTSDLGKTWTRTEPLHDGLAISAIQPSLLQLGGDSLRAVGRTRQGKVFQIDSHDSGKTWGQIVLSELPNPNSGTDAVTLRDGRHLLVYNHTAKGRSPLNLAVSRDGTAWEAGIVLESTVGEYSYPAIIQSADGLVHITYTWKRQKVKHVVVDPAQLLPKPMVNGEWAR